MALLQINEAIREATACRDRWADVREHGPRLGNECAPDMVEAWDIVLGHLGEALRAHDRVMAARRGQWRAADLATA